MFANYSGHKQPCKPCFIMKLEILYFCSIQVLQSLLANRLQNRFFSNLEQWSDASDGHKMAIVLQVCELNVRPHPFEREVFGFAK